MLRSNVASLSFVASDQFLSGFQHRGFEMTIFQKLADESEYSIGNKRFADERGVRDVE